MGKAAKTSSAIAWPPEGLSLADAVVRLLPASWKKANTPPTTALSVRQLKQDRRDLDREFRELLLKRDDLTLEGRPKEPHADPVNLSAAIPYITRFAWHSSIADGLDIPIYYDVRVCRKRVELEIDPCKSGAPGRPTPMSIIEDEASRRIESGKVVAKQNGLTKFATDLAEWWEQERQQYNPALTSVTMRSIGNSVRHLWNEALLRRP
jgi:hypothetical protein